VLEENSVAWLWTFLKWWLIFSLACLIAFALLITWDWYWFRQLPWLRWRASQGKKTMTRNLFGIAPISDSSDEGDGLEPQQAPREGNA
jgi:hypothetical protein